MILLDQVQAQHPHQLRRHNVLTIRRLHILLDIVSQIVIGLQRDLIIIVLDGEVGPGRMKMVTLPMR